MRRSSASSRWRKRGDLAEDAFLEVVLHDGVKIDTVKHFGRHLPTELRTALELGPVPEFDGVTCSHEACDRRYDLDWHHRNPVANGGESSFENVEPDCKPHHWEATERQRQQGCWDLARRTRRRR